MEASEAALWFVDTVLAGWNGTAWVAGISRGDFHSYDRFITERTFGAKKRIYLAHETNKFSPVTYPLVKTPDNKVWIVVSVNADLSTSAYAQSYLLLDAGFTAQTVTFTTTTRASGQKGAVTETLSSSIYCDVEQFGTDSSAEFSQVVHGLCKVVLPGGTAVTDDQELLIGGLRYEIQEITAELLTKAVRCLRRSVA